MTNVVNYKSASAKLHNAGTDIVFISHLASETQMQGHETELIRLLVANADADGITLQTDAKSFASVEFYRTFGFDHISAGTNLMQRKARTDKNEHAMFSL